MDLLQVDGLAKAYGSRRVLQDVSFSVAAGEVVGLVGANGAGKSTLGDVVAGRYAPDAGRMTVLGHPYAPLSAADARHLGVGAVEQLVRLDPELTVARAVCRDTELAGAPDSRVRARARAVLADVGLDLDPDQLVADVPRFVHGLVEAARVLAEDTRLVVMDEVSAALTPSEVEGLHAIARRLRSQGRGVLYISHRLPEMLAVVDRVLVLREGRIALDAPAASLEPAGLAVATLDGAVPAARPQSLPWGTSSAAPVVIPQARPAPEDSPAVVVPATTTRPEPSSDVALEVRNLRVPGSSAGIDLRLRRGEVLGLTGRRRSGLQEIAGALTGELPAQCDGVAVRGQERPVPAQPGSAPLRLAAYRPDDDAYGMDPGETIARTLTSQEWGRPEDLRSEIATLRGVIDTVHRMNVRTTSIRTVFGALSGGDQHKLALARWMAATEGDVVVVHEPTRGLDLRSRREVRRLLDDVTAHGRSVVVVSVDPDELTDVCDRIGVVADGRVEEWLDTHEMTLPDVRARILGAVATPA
ncbi:ribose transport system ATP-binding protein [Klenkia marina]|uniref:Ribose transport system ATP-binding protein n=1 Tax=Klenkia marina TaxID=1960309 RepID=A0A1G4Y7I6_9ACTN|nr:ATP-binding cassette domain-containing protein [Klenkia marina]SCX48818.1 ribose transport system ATP-binding protein [Klenkia marina]